jgi:type VI secretion system secreted protein VgrG
MANDTHFQLDSDSPAASSMLLWCIVGHETLSRPSHYELTVLSKKNDITAKEILGYLFDLVLKFQDKDGKEHERRCAGYATRFSRVGEVGRYFRYQISLQSWFGLLRKTSNCRIFQEKTVVECMKDIFLDNPIKTVAKFSESTLTNKHEKHRYCVQFNESDYKFASRLMEEEGIYYWFDSHGARNKMYIADTSSAVYFSLPATDTLKYQPSATSDARFNEIMRWIDYRHLESGMYHARDTDFKAIRKTLSLNAVGNPEEFELGHLLVKEYPAGMDRDADAEALSKQRIEEIDSRHERYWAQTRWPDVAVGRTFQFEGDPNKQADGEYLIATCSFVVSHPGLEGLNLREEPIPLSTVMASAIADDAVNHDCLPAFQAVLDEFSELRAGTRGARAFLMTVIPNTQNYRISRLTPQVTMPGPQSAIVVGQEGEEIHTDEFGRVKVHFHWDQKASDENATAYIRVSQPWAGKGWGGYFIPRIGQEVIVDFLNGDPDRPIIMGRVYNDDQPIPYQSPTQSGFKTRSTPKGNSSNYNEIMFEDKKGSESLNIHAEKNMSRSVENDDSTSVGHDQSEVVENDQTINVKHDRSVTVKNNEKKEVQQFQKLTVGKNQDNHIVGYQTTNVDIDHALLVKGNHKIAVGAERTDITNGNESRFVGGNQTNVAVGKMSFKAPTMLLEAGHIDFKVTGSNSIVWDSHDAPYKSAFKEYTLVSNTHMHLMSVGDINQTSIGVNTTVLGKNTSGYIGDSSQANMGSARSTFLGLSLDNALGLRASNFLGLNIENTMALKVENVAAIGIKRKSADLQEAAMFMFKPGVGSGAAAAAQSFMTATGPLMAIAGMIAGLTSAVIDVKATLDQYADAAEALDTAAEELSEQYPELSARLKRMANLARSRHREGQSIAAMSAGAVLAVGGGVATAALLPAAGTAAALGLAGGAIVASGGAATSLAGSVSAVNQRTPEQVDLLTPGKDKNTGEATTKPGSRTDP